MKLANISLEKTQPPAQSKVFGLNGLKPLSGAEESMILEKFPSGGNSKLELYLANGAGRTEQPNAKGQLFDRTV